MDGFDEIEDVPDADWEKLTDEQQDAYNRRVEADKEYDKTMDLFPPIILFVVGCGVSFFAYLSEAHGVVGISDILYVLDLISFGGFLCFLAVLWALMRVIDRAHCYQRLKDARDEFKRVMNP
jgi:hypothetical protein